MNKFEIFLISRLLVWKAALLLSITNKWFFNENKKTLNTKNKLEKYKGALADRILTGHEIVVAIGILHGSGVSILNQHFFEKCASIRNKLGLSTQQIKS